MGNPHRIAELVASICCWRDDAGLFRRLARSYEYLIGTDRAADFKTIAEILDARIALAETELTKLKKEKIA